jgi:hypothetical protein
MILQYIEAHLIISMKDLRFSNQRPTKHQLRTWVALPSNQSLRKLKDYAFHLSQFKWTQAQFHDTIIELYLCRALSRFEIVLDSTLNTQHSTLNIQHSILNSPHKQPRHNRQCFPSCFPKMKFMSHNMHSTVESRQSTVDNQHSTLNNLAPC